jgi:membrane protease YdiL (CAAX protease family)
MNAAIYSLTFATIVFIAFLLLKGLDKRLTYAAGILFAVYVGLDDFVTGLPPELPELRPFDTRWNWWGKLYSVALSVAVIFGLRLNRTAVGLRFPDRNIKLGLLVVPVLVLFSVAMGLLLNQNPPAPSTLAFQFSMPALAEELAYRGIAPALLLGLLHGKNPPREIPWTVICIATVPYSVVHGLAYDGESFSFIVGPTLNTLTGGIIYGWLRFHTGSLLFPFLAHSLGNLAYSLMGYLA